MKYIITEEQLSRQELYQIKWERFEKFMKRRDDEIKELISQHTHAYKYDIDRYDADVITFSVIEMVVNDFMSNNDFIDEDNVEYDWLGIYLEEHYKEYIRKELGL